MTRRKYFGPEAGLEPAIALVLGKCLNHLNYSGSKNCCSRLVRIFIRASANPYIKASARALGEAKPLVLRSGFEPPTSRLKGASS